jgi:hypothetical protein
MSEHGHKLEFNDEGIAVCPEGGERIHFERRLCYETYLKALIELCFADVTGSKILNNKSQRRRQKIGFGGNAQDLIPA